MLIPGRTYLEFRDAFRRGDGDTVLGTGQPVLDELGADPRQAGLVPAVLLMVGATLARLERYADGCAYLERGLLLLPGTDATHEVGDGDWYRLNLLGLLLATGRYQDDVERDPAPDRAGPEPGHTARRHPRPGLALCHVRRLRDGPAAAQHRGRAGRPGRQPSARGHGGR